MSESDAEKLRRFVALTEGVPFETVVSDRTFERVRCRSCGWGVDLLFGRERPRECPRCAMRDCYE